MLRSFWVLLIVSIVFCSIGAFQADFENGPSSEALTREMVAAIQEDFLPKQNASDYRVRRMVSADGAAYPGEFPWAARLVIYWKDASGEKAFTCSAVVIHPSFVLTAAHCIKMSEVPGSSSAMRVLVSAGYVDASAAAYPDAHEIYADMAWIHHLYKMDQSNRAGYDIALVHLSKPLLFNHFVQPIRIGKESTSLNCIALGWGRRSERASSQLMWLQQTFVKQTKFPLNTLSKSSRAGAAVSYGDSGGSLVCRRSSTRHSSYHLHGIVIGGHKMSADVVVTNAVRVHSLRNILNFSDNSTVNRQGEKLYCPSGAAYLSRQLTPFYAHLLVKTATGSFKSCSGVLLNVTHAMTVRSCVEDALDFAVHNSIFVVAGVNYVPFSLGSSKMKVVEKVIELKRRSRSRDSLVLLKLQENLTLSDETAPVPIIKKGDVTSALCGLVAQRREDKMSREDLRIHQQMNIVRNFSWVAESMKGSGVTSRTLHITSKSAGEARDLLNRRCLQSQNNLAIRGAPILCSVPRRPHPVLVGLLLACGEGNVYRYIEVNETLNGLSSATSDMLKIYEMK